MKSGVEKKGCGELARQGFQSKQTVGVSAYQRGVDDVVADSWAGLRRRQVSERGAGPDKKRETHVVGHVTERRVVRRPPLWPMTPPVHLLQPRPIQRVDLPPRVRLRLPYIQPGQLTALVRPGVVQSRQDLVRDRQRDVRDVEERVRERRRGQLVVLRERARVDVEAHRARVGDHHVRDGRARVVHGERVRHRGREEGEEGVVRRGRDPVKGKGRVSRAGGRVGCKGRRLTG